jgi:MFS family permease
VLPISRPRADREIRDQVAWRDWHPTIVAGVMAVGAVAVLIAAFVSVSTFERPIVLESLTGTVYWIAAALIGSCGTIAALMLTTVSLMEHLDTRRLGPRFLIHMRLTVVAALGTIGCAVGALLLTIFPSATGVDVRPPAWQINVVFFGLLALVALMVGGFAVVLSSLYATISDVFRNLPETWVQEILEAGEEEEQEEAEDEAAEERRERVGVG